MTGDSARATSTAQRRRHRPPTAARASTPGGAIVRTLPTSAQIQSIADEVAEIVDLALRNSVARDRFTGTAVLGGRDVHALGVVGYVARASSVVHDAGRDHPFHPATTGSGAVNAIRGDVLARFLVRAGEIQSSTRLLTELLALSRTRQFGTAPRMPAGHRVGTGLVEGRRGTIAHRVEIAADGTLTRLKMVDPSFLNWRALPVALAECIVADFPLVNRSFNLSSAGNDL